MSIVWVVAITFAVVFALIMGAQVFMEMAMSDDPISKMFRERSTWMQPLIGAGAVAGVVFLVWAVWKAVFG